MAAPKRKYTIIARSEHDHENPPEKKLIKKCKLHQTSVLSHWPGDVSNTFPKHKSKNHFKFSRLPDEIVLIILGYLNKASLVAFGQTCRKYRAIMNYPGLWKRVDMSYKRVNSEQLNSLLQRGTVTLKMYQTTIESLNALSIESSTLRHLDLTSTIISTDLLISLLHSCRSLRKLSLELIPLNYEIIENIVLNEHLDTLNLAMCTGLTFECCQLLTTKLPLLRSWNIAWTNLSSESVQYICETIPRCIEQLNISGQRYNLTDNHIQLLARRALRLRALDISDSVVITDQSILALRQHSRLLGHLSASRCYLLTPLGLLVLKSLPAFSTLDIFGTLAQISLQQLRDEFGIRTHVNMFPFSSIARPTTGNQRTSIWGLRTRL